LAPQLRTSSSRSPSAATSSWGSTRPLPLRHRGAGEDAHRFATAASAAADTAPRAAAAPTRRQLLPGLGSAGAGGDGVAIHDRRA
jgi:hypothetical protein